jgi:glyoxylase-like metal-dependent hydrolase (beta-lactamase superfamily II)
MQGPLLAMTTLRAAIVQVTPFQQNCTLLWDDASKRGAVIDPGGDLGRIAAAIAETGITVEKILLTHGHIDHAAGADELRERLGVPVEGPHEADRFLLDALPDSGRKYGMTGARAVVPDRWIAEGDEVEIAGHRFATLHCPGHSPGSIAYYQAESRFAHVGDVLFRGSIGRTDFPYGDHAALIAAITNKLLPLGDDVTFICGHGPMSTFGDERRSNPYLGKD